MAIIQKENAAVGLSNDWWEFVSLTRDEAQVKKKLENDLKMSISQLQDISKKTPIKLFWHMESNKFSYYRPSLQNNGIQSQLNFGLQVPTSKYADLVKIISDDVETVVTSDLFLEQSGHIVVPIPGTTLEAQLKNTLRLSKNDQRLSPFIYPKALFHHALINAQKGNEHNKQCLIKLINFWCYVERITMKCLTSNLTYNFETTQSDWDYLISLAAEGELDRLTLLMFLYRVRFKFRNLNLEKTKKDLVRFLTILETMTKDEPNLISGSKELQILLQEILTTVKFSKED